MRIKKEIPKFRKSQKYPDAKGWKEKAVVIVEFENGNGQIWQWIPTYKEITDIVNALEEIEKESWGDGNYIG